MLFPATSFFRTVRIAKVIRRDEVGQHRPALCLDVDGNLWWAKAREDMLWHGVLAEAAFSALASVVGAAVPEGAVGDVPGLGWSWLSRNVDCVTHWQDTAPETFSNHDAVGAVLALDAVLHNEDRHEANVLVAVVDAYDKQLWWIDADVAAVSTPAGLLAKGRAPPDPLRKHVRGLPISQLQAGAVAAAVALARQSAKVDLLAEACTLCARAPAAERGRLAQALQLRLAAAPEIVAAYLQSLWSL